MTLTGSIAYGTNTPDSDIDYKGVCIPPDSYFFGFDLFRDYNTTGGKRWKNTKDDIDISITHINKFVQNAMKGVPNNIEILFTNPEHILVMNKFGEELISHRQDFISKILKEKFAGFAHSQSAKMMAGDSNGCGRLDLIEKYGYDTKFFSHSVRLYTGGIEIFKTGTFATYRPNRDELIACKQGKYTLPQAIAYLAELDQELNELYKTSTCLPHTPNYNNINSWLIDLNKRALWGEW